MTDVVYNHPLPLKEFAVSGTALSEWLAANISTAISGYSKGSEYTIHFLATPTEQEITDLDAYWASLVDDGVAAAEAAKARALLIEETKIQYGIKVRAYLGYLCEQASFTPTEYGQMLTDPELSMCSALLISGALESVKGIIDAYAPTAYFTNDMQTALSAELQKYITLVSNL
jgi:hypothetical protein